MTAIICNSRDDDVAHIAPIYQDSVRTGYRYVVENSVYVDRAVYGQGIGRRLLNDLIEACREREYRNIIAVISDSNNFASIRLHKACGFTIVGVFPGIGFKFERWLDSVQMMRTL